MTQATNSRTATADTALHPAPPLDMRAAARLGLAGALVTALVPSIGMVETFQSRIIIEPFLPLGLLFMYLMPFAFGWMAARPPIKREGYAASVPGARNMAAGAIAGVLAGLGVGVLMALITAFDLRGIFIQLSPQLLETLSFGLPLGSAVLATAALGGLAGALGGGIHLLPRRLRRSLLPALMWVLLMSLLRDVAAQVFSGLRIPWLTTLIFTRRGGPLTVAGAVGVFVVFFALYWWIGGRQVTIRSRFDALPRPRQIGWSVAAMVAILAILAVAPAVFGPFLSQVLDNAGIFLLMALGLNIVLGYAGLLDLGYVAFFAVGAYTSAILTSPLSPTWAPQLSFLGALPFVMIAAVVAGAMVATPVIRMRGDYLAIVTLGFGEIARILLNSEWLAPYFGGAQGITNIPNLTIGPLSFSSPQDYFYPIFAFVLLAAYITYSLERSRWGRAWMAMREDESVAEAMGVNIVTAKLSAFVVGAILASFGGALFGAQIGSVFPHSFDIIVSITVLVIIIVGGMGNVPGVALGALILIGLPNLLREFSEFQFLFYGVLLIIMMLNRPEGFLPSRQRARELHQDEAGQDAWLEIYGDEAAASPETAPEGNA